MTTTTRTRFARRATIAATLTAAPILALGFTPIAAADATTDTASKHFSDCNIPGGSDKIWEGVKAPEHTPMHKLGNFEIKWPGHDSTRGFAVHPGVDMKTRQNLLVVPTVRESGIECPNLLDADAPNYFKDAYDSIPEMHGTGDWALGINSEDGRNRNQLHIHLTHLYSAARKDIDTAAKAGKLAKTEQAWVNSPIEVTGHELQGPDTKHTYRAWNADKIDYNFFAKLNNDIVQPLKKQGKSDAGMPHESLLITLNRQGTGLVVLESDRNTGIHGVNNIETIMDKN